MCGFLGETTTISKSNFRDLLNLGFRRGPDSQLSFIDEFVQLGFNRLAILDDSEKANQPISTPSNNYVVVFNGEIYNYKQLIEQYELTDLRSNSDTEVICQLLDKVTPKKVLELLNGMFAIAIYDTRDRKLILARDFAGIKPLFYGIDDEGFVFASQFDQVHEHPNFKNTLRLNPVSVKEYFGFGYMPAPNTIFQNIYQVKPGEFIEYCINSKKIISKKMFWSLNEQPCLNETDEKNELSLRELLKSTVKRQMVSDVPLGSFLSGGVDSPLISFFANEHENLKTFTASVKDDTFDESLIAKQYAEKLSLNYNELEIDMQGVLTKVNEHFVAITEPFGDCSSIPTYLITKEAKKHVTVMLSGDGGDEMFFGYPRFLRSIKHFNYFKLPKSIRKCILKISRIWNKKLSYGIDDIDTFGEWILRKQMHLTNFEGIFKDYTFSEETHLLYSEHVKNKVDALLFLRRNEFYGHLQKVLRKVDLTSMANSLEVRVPFLDKQVLEFTMQIKPELGIVHEEPKYLLKRLLKSLSHADFPYQPKKGFSVPIKEWLRGPLKNDLLELMLKPIFGLKECGFNEEILRNDIFEFLNGNDSIDSWGVWHVYSWQKWAAKYKFI